MKKSACFLVALSLMGEFKLKDALQGFVQHSRLKNGLRSAQIDMIWQELMGKAIAKYTDKIEIRNQTLFITTAVGPLKKELTFQKSLIIQRLNELLGEEIIAELVVY